LSLIDILSNYVLLAVIKFYMCFETAVKGILMTLITLYLYSCNYTILYHWKCKGRVTHPWVQFLWEFML